MLIAFEILKESDLRKSTTSSSSISILGGLILGDAAVSAGIVSPIMIIVIAISSISALIFQSKEFNNTIRFYQYNFLLLSTFLGIIGIIVLLLISLIQTKTFGYSYLSMNKNEILDSIIKIDRKTQKRNTFLTKNETRGNI